jgi:hypothetical protein
MTRRSESTVRIVAIRPAPIGRIFAIIYAVFGLLAFLLFAVANVAYLALPFGVLAPFLHLNLNLNLARSDSVLYNILLCVAAVISYALTGWLTGMTVAFCFNFTAKRMGGVDAKYFSVAQKQDTEGGQ